MASLRRLVSLPNRLTSLSSIARRSAVALPCGHDMGACTCHIRPSSAGNTRYMTTAAVPIVSSATAVVTPVTAPRVGVSAARQQRIAEEQKVLKQACGEAVEEEPEMVSVFNPETGEFNGPRGKEPTRYGDWEKNGRCYDF